MKRGGPARALLGAAVVLLGGSCGSSAPLAVSLGANELTVVVLVVDSLMPDEIGASTPNLAALKAAGTFYAQSRSVYAAETIPNHVAMMTGVYPTRSGIPTNDFIDDFDVAEPDAVKLSIPERLTANTLFTWIQRACGPVNPDLRTGATLSKTYLYEIFAGDGANATRANDNDRVFNLPPGTHWDPRSSPAYLPDPDEHTPDVPTMTQALAQLPDADFLFINLGDVDRSAHAGGPAFRSAVLPDTDAQVGRLVTALQDSGRWDKTVLFVVSDHGMDFSNPGPGTVISLQGTLDGLAACFEPMTYVPSGGTASISVLDRAAPLAARQAALRAARTCLLDPVACATACPGAAAPANAALIDGAWYVFDDPVDTAGNMPATIDSHHPNFGDLTVFAKATGKFGEVFSATPQIPGNHGHPLTLHNTFLVSGGSPWVKAGQVVAASVPAPGVLDRLPEQSENVDVAPTVAWLLGLGLDAADFPDHGQFGRGFDGRILKEAFAQFDADANAAAPTTCGRFD